jgi:hypothetical protein
MTTEREKFESIGRQLAVTAHTLMRESGVSTSDMGVVLIGIGAAILGSVMSGAEVAAHLRLAANGAEHGKRLAQSGH